ncbi:MAG: hypothetical protein H6750_00415 [Nitrospiraceae bacterium]|nr:hypothetical protein [Nitrospiraceae bacterium]
MGQTRALRGDQLGEPVLSPGEGLRQGLLNHQSVRSLSLSAGVGLWEGV